MTQNENNNNNKKPRGRPPKNNTPTPKHERPTGDDLNCRNCKFSTARNGSTFLVCDVDLPPFVNQSNDPKRRLVHESYRCALHRYDKIKVETPSL